MAVETLQTWTFESALPADWDTHIGTNTSYFTSRASGSGLDYPTIAAYAGQYALKFPVYMIGNGQSVGVRFPIDLTGNTGGGLRFQMSQDSGYPQYSNDKLQVYWGSTTDLASATLVGTFYRYDAGATPPRWVERTVSLPAASDNAAGYIFLLAVSGYGQNIYVDNVELLAGTSGTSYEEAPADSFSFSDTVTADIAEPPPPPATYDEILADTVGVADVGLGVLTSYNVFSDTLVEQLSLGEEWTIISPLRADSVVVDTLGLSTQYATALGTWAAVEDPLRIMDLAPCAIGKVVTDYLSVRGTLLSLWRGSLAVNDRFTAYDNAVRGFADLLADTVTVTDGEAIRIGVRLIESLRALDSALNNWAGTRGLADSISLADLLPEFRGFMDLLEDGFSVEDIALDAFFIACLIADSLVGEDAAETAYTGNALLVSAMGISSEVATSASFADLLADGLEVDFQLVLDGQLYQCWALNTESMFPSFYTNYAFNSYAELGGTVYAAKEDGIYVLGGTEDAGQKIHTGLKLNLDNFGTHWKKRMHMAYFGVSGTTPAVKAITEEGEVQYYVVDGRIAAVKGHEGRSWEFNLTQVDSIDFIEITPLIMVR